MRLNLIRCVPLSNSFLRWAQRSSVHSSGVRASLPAEYESGVQGDPWQQGGEQVL